MNEEQLQQQFMQLLVQEAQKAGAKTEADVKAYIESLGKEGLQQKYQQFVQQMQGGVKAALGAKLEYFKKLKGSCPEGQELVYFKKGGKICKACQGKKMKKETENPIKDFKDKKNSKKLAKGGNTPQWKQKKESYNGWGKGERWRTQAHNMFTQMNANQRAAFDTDGVEGLSRDEVINMQKSLGFTGRMLDGKIGRDTIARFENKFGKLDYNNNNKDLIVGNYSPYLEEQKTLPQATVLVKRQPKPEPKPEPSYWDSFWGNFVKFWRSREGANRSWGVGGNGVTNSPVSRRGSMP